MPKTATLQNIFSLANETLLLNSLLLFSCNSISCNEVDGGINTDNAVSIICNVGKEKMQSCSCNL